MHSVGCYRQRTAAPQAKKNDKGEMLSSGVVMKFAFNL